MGFLIDSSLLIEWERGRLDLGPHVDAHGPEECFLSVITASELLHGVHRAREPHVRARRSAFVEGLLAALPLLPLDLASARLHAQLWADLQTAGTLVGPHDLWLAASCIAHGHTLATANLREFLRVPGLKVECWSQPPTREA